MHNVKSTIQYRLELKPSLAAQYIRPGNRYCDEKITQCYDTKFKIVLKAFAPIAAKF